MAEELLRAIRIFAQRTVRMSFKHTDQKKRDEIFEKGLEEIYGILKTRMESRKGGL